MCQPVTGFFEIPGQTGGGSWINLAGFDCSGPRSCCNSILALTATGTAVSSRLPKTVNLDVIFQLLRDRACTTLNNTPTEHNQWGTGTGKPGVMRATAPPIATF